MPVGKSPGLPKSAIAPSSANVGPLRENCYGPHRAIRTVGTGASVCLSSSGLCNPIRRIRDLNYEVIRTNRSRACQIYHLNLLKKWSEVQPVMLATAISSEDDLGSEVNTKIQSLTLAPGGDHLLPSQLTDVARLQTEFADVFSPLPGRTNLIQHHIESEPGVVVRSRPYRLPEHKKKVVQLELEAMLEVGVIEESHSDWASPIVLVSKTNSSVRFCVDYRKVNAVSKLDAYPMPQVDELLDRLGTARIYSTLDLTKRYWQIPLSPLSK